MCAPPPPPPLFFFFFFFCPPPPPRPPPAPTTLPRIARGGHGRYVLREWDGRFRSADLPAEDRVRARLRYRQAFEGSELFHFRCPNATDYVVPCLEIVDSRTHRIDPETKRQSSVLDSIADNAAAGALVIGGRPIRPMELDLRWVAALCHRNGMIEESGVAAAVLNHPANGVAWLANKLSGFDVGIEPGEFVSAGSFTGMVDVRAGDNFHVDYSSLGSVPATSSSLVAAGTRSMHYA